MYPGAGDERIDPREDEVRRDRSCRPDSLSFAALRREGHESGRRDRSRWGVTCKEHPSMAVKGKGDKMDVFEVLY